jgi:hypothetical protein
MSLHLLREAMPSIYNTHGSAPGAMEVIPPQHQVSVQWWVSTRLALGWIVDAKLVGKRV